MKKLLVATGIFLSVGLMASAQEKKSAVTPAAAPAPAEQMLTADQKRNRKKLKYVRQQRTAQKVQEINHRPASTDPRAKETISNSN